MGFYRSISGFVQFRVVCADIPECLRLLEQEGISASSIRILDAVTLMLTASRKDLQKLQHLCDRKGYALHITQKQGLFWSFRAMIKRPVFAVGLILLMTLAVCLPGRILFLETEGNDSVPSRYILEQAQDCGLKFWCRRREVRSEQVKNGLLEAIPQLQWVGVNTYGCRAVITVRERTEHPVAPDGAPVSHIVASRDGVVQSCTVTRGSGNCVAGQAVRKGDILISGFTDCGLSITAEQAEGTVLAQTQRTISTITPETWQIQLPEDGSRSRYSLLVGKKRINFYKGSGISGATCDKMYSKYVLTLPGGFELPVALLKESTVSCRLTEVAVNHPALMLEAYAANYLNEQMTDGAVLRKSESLTKSDGVFLLTGVYDCQENIGIVQEEKIGEYNGEANGADRERGSGG